LRIAKLLIDDATYKEVVFSLHVSYATVAKVSVWLNSGGNGLRNVISKLPVKYDVPKNLSPIPIEFQLPQAAAAFYQYAKASGQNENLEKFLAGVENKQTLDRELRESFSEEFIRTKTKNK
jgi:hypothetical protein